MSVERMVSYSSLWGVAPLIPRAVAHTNLGGGVE